MTPTLLLLVQLLVVVVVARLCGRLLRWVGQPPVIGEMAAGLVLGPMVLGAWLPDTHAALFPAASMPALSALASLGVVFFMFVVGLELRAPAGTRAQVRTAFSVGGLGIVLPLTLGLAIAPLLYPDYAPNGVAFWPFALFIAAAMSVTAFPVLARILKDRGMTRTTPGYLALTAAVIDDACVWVFLALVLMLAGRGDGHGLAITAIGAGVLVTVAFGLLKPWYARVLQAPELSDRLAAGAWAQLLAGVLACAAFAEWIGLHAVFGAFLFGIILPRDDRLLHALSRRIEPLAVALLMPVLFAVVGQNATTDVFTGAGLGVFALVMVVAIVGKVVGCATGARLNGYGWRDSLAVGSLMNARGLMELIIIKIGLDAGLIGPELFTMLFAMALITTVMASPLLSLFHVRGRKQVRDQSDPDDRMDTTRTQSLQSGETDSSR